MVEGSVGSMQLSRMDKMVRASAEENAPVRLNTSFAPWLPTLCVL